LTPSGEVITLLVVAELDTATKRPLPLTVP